MNVLDQLASDSTSLKNFIQAFDYKLITINVQRQAERAQLIPGKLFGGVNLIRAIPPDEFFSNEVQTELRQAQANGYGVLFMVNEGNGLPSPEAAPGNLNCGKRTNVKILKSLFIDTDDVDGEAIMVKLITLRFIPHFIIETSPKRYHFYFLIDPVPAEGDAILWWKALQKKLHSLLPGMDQSMSDINQLLRLPDYFNLKKPPYFKVKVFKENLKLARYNLKDMFDKLEANEFLDMSLKPTYHVNGHATYKPYVFPQSLHSILPGNRRAAICSYIEHIMENVVPLEAKDEDFYVLINAFIMQYLQPADQKDFLPGGSRRQNIEQYFHDQKNFRLKKRYVHEAATSIKKLEHVTALEEDKLPNKFYLTFPGDLGMITREIHKFAPHLSLELCFAGALCVSGAVKAEIFKYRGYWPMVNGMIVAPTGAGKTTLKNIVEKILATAGFLGSFPQLLDFPNSVQALHTDLYAAGGVGTFWVDEAKEYLEGLTSRKSPGYVREIKAYIKRATTGLSDGNRLSPGRSMSFKKLIIENGFLSIWMALQPEMFSGVLSMDDMRDGFLPRFLVFKGKGTFKFGDTLFNTERVITFEPSVELRVWLESHLSLYSHATDDQIKDELERVRIATLTEVSKKYSFDLIEINQAKAIYALRSTARRLGDKVEVILTSDATDALKAYLKEAEDNAATIASSSDGGDLKLDIYARFEEMVARLICNAASIKTPGERTATVDLALVEAIVKFHRFQTDRFFRTEVKQMESDPDAGVDLVTQAVTKAFIKKGDRVTTREILMNITSSKRPQNIVALLNEAKRRCYIIEEHREHKTAIGKTIVVYRPVPSEDEELIN